MAFAEFNVPKIGAYAVFDKKTTGLHKIISRWFYNDYFNNLSYSTRIPHSMQIAINSGEFVK